MKSKKILIIEDEKPNSDRVKRLLKILRPDAEILATLDTVKSSIEWLSTQESPDIIIMDIRLADGLSFDIFSQIKVTCPVIFTTAYDEYAVRAFKYNSVDYLLKPIEKDELEIALNKYEGLIHQTQDISPVIESLLNYMKSKDYRSRFLLPYRDGYKTILINDIAFFYSETKVTYAKLANGATEIVPQTLEELEQQLDPKYFFRANRQYILHIDSIQHVHNYFNNKLKIELKKNTEIEVLISREKATLFKAWMDY